MNRLQVWLLLGMTVFLVQCSSADTSEDETESDVTGAYDAVEWSLRVARNLGEAPAMRPSAVLGLYIASYLGHSSVFQSALAGIEAQMQLYLDDDEAESESYALLEELGTILQIDVPDMLNRSQQRPQALDAYLEGLQNSIEESTAEQEALEQQLDELADERRDKRKIASDIQRELNAALREQDYSTAGGLQQRLIQAEGDVGLVEAEEDETRATVNLFKKLLDIGADRMAAIVANREALLAGVMVTELPGVDDLGLIKTGRRGRGSGLGAPLVDPSL